MPGNDTAQIFEMQTSECQVTLRGHQGVVVSVTFAPEACALFRSARSPKGMGSPGSSRPTSPGTTSIGSPLGSRPDSPFGGSLLSNSPTGAKGAPDLPGSLAAVA